MTGDATLDFFFLNGDVTRDRHVNAQDFAILSAHYGQSGMTFQQGDLNYDGTVNALDFNILAMQYNKFLAPPAAPALGAIVGGTTATSTPAAATSAPAIATTSSPFSSTAVSFGTDKKDGTGTSLVSDVLGS